ncbi:tripartite tricarboxylate transporter substrate binding protein [Xenophilus arseniciresistens]|uniref:Tripartite tricarboxylate transporter substrate binding protein n=1 Tax=Xenophilus arseniciresistens TaxID=1283306 RepID=A0AAE3T0U4_9BURK|nr:tripartite tricarboxylate transporter substrate binding protein [Xenophilus arseniciresistens]MDA7418577.1 tripartite tricarboxylate transporter substrate binding protein [Xenophilus arseniciresistens]
MSIHRRTIIRTALASTLAGLGAAPWMHAHANAPLRIVSPFNAGGVNDVLARAIAKPLTELLGQSVIVENRPGAGGSIAAGYVARATPDGNTLLMGLVDTQSIIQFIYKKLPYNPDTDLRPVSLVTSIPIVLMRGPSLGQVRTMSDLVQLAKSRPGALTFGSWGVGSIVHLAMERLLAAQGLEMLHVPFSGQAPAVQAVLAGQVDMMFVPAGAADAAARDGRVRILASATPARLELLPQAPTLRELGIDLSMGLWQALYAPAGTPEATVHKLTAAVHEAMQDKGFFDVVRLQGARPDPSSAESLRKLQTEERQIYGALVKRLDIKLE